MFLLPELVPLPTPRLVGPARILQLCSRLLFSNLTAALVRRARCMHTSERIACVGSVLVVVHLNCTHIRDDATIFMTYGQRNTLPCQDLLSFMQIGLHLGGFI